MGMSTTRNRFALWLFFLIAVLLPTACTPDAGNDGGRDEQATQQAEVDRQLNLALADLDNEPELRDTGEPEVQKPAAAPKQPKQVTPPPPAPEPEPQPEPESEPQPEPEPNAPKFAEAPDAAEEPTAEAEADAGEPAAEERLVLPTGTPFDVRLEQQLSTEFSRPGDVFMAKVSDPIFDADGREIIPAGSEIMGKVVSVRAPDRSGENGSIEVDFTRVFIDGESYPLDATATTATRLETVGEVNSGPSAGSRAARGAVVGAILGGLFGGKKGTLIGAGSGAAAAVANGGGLPGGPGIQAILAAGAQLSCVVNTPFVGPPYLRNVTR